MAVTEVRIPEFYEVMRTARGIKGAIPPNPEGGIDGYAASSRAHLGLTNKGPSEEHSIASLVTNQTPNLGH